MNSATRVTLPELIKWQAQARQILLPQRRMRTQPQAGAHTARVRGRGVDFAEVRMYQAGDEIRNMDWRVTARTGKPHTKLYHQEQEYSVYFVVDYRSSMWFGTRKQFKAVQAAHATALLAWASQLKHHSVGGIILTDHHLEHIAPQPRQTGVLNVLNALEKHQPDDNTVSNKTITLAQLYLHLQQVIRPGHLICYFSDFYGFNDEAQRQFQALARLHDMWIGFVYDRLEAKLPAPNYYSFSDGVKITELNTQSQSLQLHYQQQFEKRYAKIKQCCENLGIAYQKIATDDVLVEALRQCHVATA